MSRVWVNGAIAALALAAAPALATAQAGERFIGPEHLQVVDRERESFDVSPLRATSADATPAVFWAPVVLPAGSRIRRFTFCSWGAVSTMRTARLYRVRTGDVPELLMELATNEDRPIDGAPVALDGTPSLAPPPAYVVRRNYRYYVELTAAGPTAYLQGVKVAYR